jgi:hypothetical protein
LAVAIAAVNKVEHLATLQAASLLEPLYNTIIWPLPFLLLILWPKAAGLLFIQELCPFIANFYCNCRKTAKKASKIKFNFGTLSQLNDLR